jgi:hypothetical protein
MSYRGQCKLVRKLAGAALGGAAVLAANSGAALAAYGPPSPPPATPVPGGFYCVVTSQTIGRASQAIGSLRLDGIAASIRVRRETFRGRVQATITEPYGHRGGCAGGPGIGSGGFRGYRAVGGVGIIVQRHGSADRRKFAKPLVLRMTSPSIRPSSLIVVWNGKRFERAAAVIGRGSATVRVAGSSDVAVLSRLSSAARPGAATAARPRGAGEGFLAAALLTSGGAPPGLGVLIPARRPAAGSRRAAPLPATASERR